MMTKDDRYIGTRDLGILIQWLGSPCHCRCCHCSLDSGSRVTMVAFERARALADKFVHWRRAHGMPCFSVDLGLGYSYDSPHLAESIAFNRQYGGTSGVAFVNGIKSRCVNELKEHFLSLMRHGVTTVGVTFYGLRDFHNKWSGRNDDFDYMLLASRIAAECGLGRQESVLLSRQSASDLAALMQTLDDIPGRAVRSIFPWDYRGRGKALESERITLPDLADLPESVKHLISLDRPQKYRPEAEWVERIAAGLTSQRQQRYYVVTVWEDNIDELEALDCSGILQEMRDADERLYQAIPSLQCLAELYGHRRGLRLYSLRDLEWKWIDYYLKAHPEIDGTGRFDDLGTAILWRPSEIDQTCTGLAESGQTVAEADTSC